MVWYAQSTQQSSSTHDPLVLLSLFLIQDFLEDISIHNFGFPLAQGCATEVRWYETFLSSQNFLNRASMNYHPLSVTSALRMPNLQMIALQTKSIIFDSVIRATSSAFTHLIKQSTVTSRNLHYPEVKGNEPKISIPHC